MLENHNQANEIELLESPKYYIALTALFRNEARFLKEWIEFHKLMGVEQFYLVNHLSEDDYRDVLEPYIGEGIVELFHVLYEPENDKEWRYVKNTLHLEIIEKIKNQVEWLVVIDTDEFLFPIEEQNLTEVLKQYDDYAALVVNWRVFGPADVQRIQADELMIEKLVKRDKILDLHIKSIVKPRYVANFNTHYATMKPGYEQVTENYQDAYESASSISPSNNVLTINHYYARDWEFFNSTKLFRMHVGCKDLSEDKKQVKLNKLIENNERFSSVYDDSILRFAPALRMQMFQSHPDMSSRNIEDLPGMKQLVHLPDNLLYVMESGRNISYSMKHGYGVDPIMIKKIKAFAREGESYAELGGSHYGEFALQMSKKLGPDGAVYIFEPDQVLLEFYKMSRFLSNASNIKLEDNIVVMDSYFQDRALRLDIVRINLEDNTCSIFGGMESIIDSSKDLRLFIKWQPGKEKCLEVLAEKGFIFVDILKFNEECSYLNYQLNYQLTIEDIAKSGKTEFLAVRAETFEIYRKLHSDNPECVALASKMMFFAAYNGRLDDVKSALSNGAEIDYYEEDVNSPSLYSAIGENHPTVVRFFLSEGADVELGYKRVVTPLFVAAEYGRKDMVEMLLCSNANREFTFFGRSPAQVALDNGHTEVHQMLMGEVEINCGDGELG